jgi:RHS repeat-associated protein
VFKYDQLGRKISRVDAPVSGIPVSYQWIWDTKQKGMLTSEAGNGQVITYSYDGLSRVNNLNTSIAGLSNRAFVYAYDNYSRPTTTTYPKGFKIKRIYHAAGISTQTQDITDINNPKVLWALGDEIDLRGNYNSELWGNGVVTKTLYDQNNGQIENIISGRLSNSNKVINLFGDIQSLSYDSDSISNILSRTSQRTNAAGAALENLKEVFIYDALNRLKTSTTSGLFTRFKDYAYDELGNLKSRSDTATVGGSNTDVGALTYDRINGAGVNAVTSAGGQNYQYDKYGNMRKRGTETIDYNVFNKPIKIVGAATTTIEYDAENTRFREKNGNLITYSIVGGQYEEVINGTTSIQKNYVDGVILNTQTLSGSSITANETAYLHPDNAGSVEAITNALGTLVTRMSFSDWGSRQLSDWRSGTPATNFPTPEGYTGHYQMDQSKLVHMGGRVYDPNLGRFLSADLLVSSPFNSQSYNRYSYVNNNPLSRTDPTGYREDYSRLFLRSLEDSSSVFQWSSAVNSSFLAWGGTLQDDGSVTGITFWMESVPVANYASLQGLSRNQVYSNFYECMGMCHGNDGVTTDFLPDKDQQLLALSFTEFSAVAVGGIACGASVICGAVIGTSIFEASQDPIDLVGLGGAHNVVRGLPKRHSHHMPAAAASSLSYGKGPAISMSIADHKLTASFGPSRDAKAYREIQRQLIEKGKFREAQLMDIKDVQSLFGEKYNASIKQMLAYTTSLGL